MKTLTNTERATVVVVIISMFAAIAGYVYAHCQIPCGIYDDDARAEMIAEHIKTIDKAMKQITTLSAETEKNYNQIVRWVQNKETHADEIAEIVTQYFMAQRIKPAESKDKEAYESYIANLTILHEMLVVSMKAKQTTDVKQVEELKTLLDRFRQTYKGFSHKP